MAQETDSYSLDIFSPEELTKYPVTLGDGGGIVSLPPFVVSETGFGQPTYESLFSVVQPTFTPPQSNVGGGGALVNRMPVAQPLEGNDIYTQIYNQELARRNAIRQAKGELPIAAYDTAEINQLADWAKGQVEMAGQQQDAAAALAARNAAASGGQLGIPLVLPLPVDPITGLIITGAGLIASGGNIAKLDPSNPLGSLAGAAEGTINTIGSIPGQIGNLVTGGNTTGTGTTTGGPGMGAGGEAGGTSTEGTILVPPGAIGGNSGNTATTPSDTGTSSTGSSMPIIGGAGAAQKGMDASQLQGVMGTILGGVTSAQKTQQAAEQQKTSDIQSIGAIPASGTGAQTGMDATQARNVMDAILGGVTSAQQAQKATEQQKTTDIQSLGVVPTTTTKTTDTTNKSTQDNKTIDIGTNTTKNTVDDTKKDDTAVIKSSTSSSTLTNVFNFPFIYGTQTSSYTPMATTVYQRNLPKELSTSSSALFGQIPLVDASGQPTGGSTNLMDQYMGMYQNMLGQTMLGNTLTGAGARPGLTSQIGQQLAADQAKLQRVQQGQLAAEDVRNAQQAAREAYGARGQVMGQGAIGAEILNREAIRQQRENEARAAYQGSVQNALNATQLQTGNIFSPIGSLVSSTFNPLAPYEADVYGTNVNALNADQIAAANRAAALEAAKLGQTGTYASALGTFLGSQTGQTGIQNLMSWLMGGSGAKTPGT